MNPVAAKPISFEEMKEVTENCEKFLFYNRKIEGFSKLLASDFQFDIVNVTSFNRKEFLRGIENYYDIVVEVDKSSWKCEDLKVPGAALWLIESQQRQKSPETSSVIPYVITSEVVATFKRVGERVQVAKWLQFTYNQVKDGEDLKQRKNINWLKIDPSSHL